MNTKVTYEISRTQRRFACNWIKDYPMENSDWNVGHLPGYDNDSGQMEHFITRNNQIELDPWNREFIPYVLTAGHPYQIGWQKTVYEKFDWRWTSIDGIVVALHRIYE